MLLDISHLQQKIKGVLHIGAYIGEEIVIYKNLGIKNIIFFEPVYYTYTILKRNVENIAKTYNVALGNFNGQTDIFVSVTPGGIIQGSGASSSILKPKKHLEQYPNITFPYVEKIEVRKLDDFIIEEQINIKDYNMINIDVQGYELEVFKGAKIALNHIDYIVTEVNRDEVYEKCAQVDEIDLFLEQYSIMRTRTIWAGDIWGDALYEKFYNTI